eukprot:6491100-Amphidinium_carterae.4
MHITWCESFKEDVKRLKESLSRTNKSITQVVASALQATPWWQHQMDEHFAKAPNNLDKKRQITSMQATLTNMTVVNAGDSTKLLEILKAMPSLSIMVRAGAIEAFKVLLKSRVSELAELINKSEPHVWAVCDVTNFMDVFNEASTVWPYDVDFQNMLSELAHVKQTCARLQTTRDIIVLAEDLRKAPLEDEGSVWPALQKFYDNVMSVSELELTQPWEKTLRGLVEYMCDFMDIYWEKLKKDLKAMQVSCLVVHQVATLLKDDATCASTKALKDTFKMCSCFAALSDCPPEASQQDRLDATTSLQRALDAMVMPEGENKPLLDKPIFEQVTEHVKHVGGQLAVSKSKLLLDAVQHLKTNIEHVVDIHLGVSGGKNWLEEFSGEDFDALMAHAEETLLKLSPKAMAASITTLEQVRCGIAPTMNPSCEAIELTTEDISLVA